MPRLVVRNLSCGHDRRVVLEDIGFTLESGELLCVLGPNGAGKSTLFRTLLGRRDWDWGGAIREYLTLIFADLC